MHAIFNQRDFPRAMSFALASTENSQVYHQRNNNIMDSAIKEEEKRKTARKAVTRQEEIKRGPFTSVESATTRMSDEKRKRKRELEGERARPATNDERERDKINFIKRYP